MCQSHLRDKSKILEGSATLLHEEQLYPAVARAAYYSCYQLLMHIWLYSMGRSEDDLRRGIGQSRRQGSHEYLLNQVFQYITHTDVDFVPEDLRRSLRSEIIQLKRLRSEADYNNTLFDFRKSEKAIILSKKIRPILKRY